MTNTAKIILGLIVAVLVVWGGYSIYNRQTTEPTAIEPIKIGFIGPLTGKAGNLGERARDGFLLSYEELKNKGLNIKIFVEDDECLANKAVSAYRKLVDVDKVKFIVGPVCSTGALAVASLAEIDEVIIISTGAAAPSLSYAGDFVFRNHTDVKQELNFLFDFLSENYEYQNIATIFLKDNDYSVEGEKFLREKLFSEKGMSMTYSEGSFSNSDYRTIITKLKQSEENIDLVFVDLLTKDVLIFLKQMQELKFDKPIVSTKVVNNPEFLDSANQLGEGIIFAEADFDQSTNPHFWDQYNSKFGENPNIFAAQSYEALALIADIIENKCKNVDPSCVKNELYQINNWPGITGMLSVDQNGDFAKNISIKEIRDGKVIKIK